MQNKYYDHDMLYTIYITCQIYMQEKYIDDMKHYKMENNFFPPHKFFRKYCYLIKLCDEKKRMEEK